MALTISGSSIGPWTSGQYTTTGNPVSRTGSGGYVKLEGGMIYQCGQCYSSSNFSRTGNYISFPLSFPNALLGLVLCERGAYGWGSGDGSTGACTIYVVTNADAYGFYWRAAWMLQDSNYYGNGLGGSWHAIGY